MTKSGGNLAAALATIQSRHSGGTCTVATIHDRMAPADQVVFVAALHNPDISSRGLADALGTIGIDIHRDRIARHRRRECVCHQRGHPTACPT